MRATFEEYYKISKKDIEHSIKKETSGDLESALVTLGTHANIKISILVNLITFPSLYLSSMHKKQTIIFCKSIHENYYVKSEFFLYQARIWGGC